MDAGGVENNQVIPAEQPELLQTPGTQQSFDHSCPEPGQLIRFQIAHQIIQGVSVRRLFQAGTAYFIHIADELFGGQYFMHLPSGLEPAEKQA